MIQLGDQNVARKVGQPNFNATVAGKK